MLDMRTVVFGQWHDEALRTSVSHSCQSSIVFLVALTVSGIAANVLIRITD